jgi:hypothetical protein
VNPDESNSMDVANSESVFSSNGDVNADGSNSMDVADSKPVLSSCKDVNTVLKCNNKINVAFTRKGESRSSKYRNLQGQEALKLAGSKHKIKIDPFLSYPSKKVATELSEPMSIAKQISKHKFNLQNSEITIDQALQQLQFIVHHTNNKQINSHLTNEYGLYLLEQFKNICIIYQK